MCQTKGNENLSSLSQQVAITQKYTKITRFPWFLGKFLTCSNSWNQVFFPLSVNAGYKASLLQLKSSWLHSPISLWLHSPTSRPLLLRLTTNRLLIEAVKYFMGNNVHTNGEFSHQYRRLGYTSKVHHPSYTAAKNENTWKSFTHNN